MELLELVLFLSPEKGAAPGQRPLAAACHLEDAGADATRVPGVVGGGQGEQQDGDAGGVLVVVARPFCACAEGDGCRQGVEPASHHGLRRQLRPVQLRCGAVAPPAVDDHETARAGEAPHHAELGNIGGTTHPAWRGDAQFGGGLGGVGGFRHARRGQCPSRTEPGGEGSGARGQLAGAGGEGEGGGRGR